MNNEEAQKYLNELAQIDEQILNLGTDIEGIKDKIMELRWKPFDDAQDKLDGVINEYQTLRTLLGDEESFYNDDGSFTENGLSNVLLIQESIDATKDKLANYRVGLEKVEEQYKHGCLSAEEYEERTEKLLNGIQDASASLAEYRQQMLSVYETQITKENDLLQKNIDKRLEALDAKEKYYEYDKTLKKKTKDINTLKAQIAALEGTSNATAKARLEKLKAELSDAEEDMQDTVHQHETEMKKTGYENLQTDAENALDNTLDALKKNTNFQEAVINNMLTNVKTNYDSTYKHLGDVMDQYGLKVSDTFNKMIGKAADFNTAAVNATKAWEEVTKIDTSKVSGTGNTKADEAVNNTMNNNDNSNDASLPTIHKPTLNKHSLYLVDGGMDSETLTVKWDPNPPHDATITWTSSDKSVAKVDKNGKVTAGNNIGKAVITATGGEGKDECKVFVVSYANYSKIRQTATTRGLELTDDDMRAGLKYSYQNGDRATDTSQASIGFIKSYLQRWFNNLPNRPNGATDIPDGVSKLVGYFNSKGKKVGPKEMQELANILGISTPGVAKYDYWGTPLKNKILNAYKSYGFSKGGVVRGGIPASILDMIGADALIPRGDSTLIGANPGETVLTEEFTKQLKPTVQILNEFNRRIAQPITEPSAAVQNRTTEITSENHFTFNNPVIKSEEDVRKLIEKAMDDRTKKNKSDWRKVR